jgi:hypothetical protein
MRGREQGVSVNGFFQAPRGARPGAIGGESRATVLRRRACEESRVPHAGKMMFTGTSGGREPMPLGHRRASAEAQIEPSGMASGVLRVPPARWNAAKLPFTFREAALVHAVRAHDITRLAVRRRPTPLLEQAPAANFGMVPWQNCYRHFVFLNINDSPCLDAGPHRQGLRSSPEPPLGARSEGLSPPDFAGLSPCPPCLRGEFPLFPTVTISCLRHASCFAILSPVAPTPRRRSRSPSGAASPAAKGNRP